jgi:uroporphyrinogen-III decarboxylase
VGGPMIFHVCGNCLDHLELFAESGVDAYHFEWQVDARAAVEKIGKRISLIGNLNNPKTLLQGTPEDVYKQERYAIEAGVDIIGPECAVPLTTPLANLRAISAAVREGY